MKKLLIISPYFPPANAADMQRVRMSLSYFESFGWQPEVVCVALEHSDINKDPLLLESIPAHIPVHTVNALAKSITSKFGLGSIALRSLYFYKKKVNSILKTSKFDLIYFSTTQFPVCILGAYWKKKFGIPYVIDMQDPWHSEYYRNKPKSQRPPKYWFSYRLNKYLEPLAMRKVDGLVSVSDRYIQTLKRRYPIIKDVPAATITFGAYPKDFDIVQKHAAEFETIVSKNLPMLNLVYIGRGGHDMKKALSVLFGAFATGLAETPDLFSKFRFHFLGTSYAAKGMGKKTISSLAESMGLANYVTEITDRIPFYQSLATLTMADGLIIPGSDDRGYTASKLYPCILAKKPLLGIFHHESSATSILKQCYAGQLIDMRATPQQALDGLTHFLHNVKNQIAPNTDWQAFEHFTAKQMAKRQCEFFDSILISRPLKTTI